jgi:hypothetical protein
LTDQCLVPLPASGPDEPSPETGEAPSDVAAETVDDERNAVPVATAPVAFDSPPVSATILRLDSGQATFLGAAIVLCLVTQVAIVFALLRHRTGHGPVIPTSRAVNRSTSVIEFNKDRGLLAGAGGTLHDTWQSEEEALERQDEAIIEELVSKNVVMGSTLARS